MYQRCLLLYKSWNTGYLSHHSLVWSKLIAKKEVHDLFYVVSIDFSPQPRSDAIFCNVLVKFSKSIFDFFIFIFVKGID